MRRITGTHVYSYAKCPRLAALDLSLDRSERRAPHAWEEFSMQRGRDFEDRYVEQLGVVQPKYAPRDWEEGARATMELMRNGAPWIHQGVLLADDRLGIPDLMRKVEGASALGDHHYEVIDVKSSGRARGDQVLQVLFYTRLLAEAQQRMPDRGGIVLKTGAEHTFVVADYLAVASEDGAVVRTALPRSRDEEWSCLRSLLAELPIDAPLLHFDSALPRWYEAHAWDREAEVGLSSRFFDMQRRLRAWALMPEPVYSLGDFVRVVLARDPLRAGHASQAAMWAEAGDDDALVQKARADLDDLAELKRRILDAAPLTFATL